MTGHIIGPKEEPTAVSRLGVHCIKMSPNDLSSCPQINVSMNPHLRSFSLQLMVINTGVHNWPNYRELESEKCSVLKGIHITHTLPGLRNCCRRRIRKNMRAWGGWLQGNIIFWTQQGGISVDEQKLVVTTCTKLVSAQVRANSNMERGICHTSHPKPWSY